MHWPVVLAFAVGVMSMCVPLFVSRQVRPDFAARVISALATLSAAAIVWTLLLVAGSNIVQLHGIAERLSWCSDVVARHRESFSVPGFFATLAVLAIVVSTIRVLLRQRRYRTSGASSSEIAVLPSDAPTAFALPGRPGQVVVSRGMLQSLDPDECRVLLAHERAHLRCRHHRYVRVTEVAAAAVPALAPLTRRVRYATERWADEEAVREIGDRAVVARAVARAALVQTDAAISGLGIADTGIVGRVESLLSDAPLRAPIFEAALRGVVVIGTLALVVSVVLVEPFVLQLLGWCR